MRPICPGTCARAIGVDYEQMPAVKDASLRKHLLYVLNGGGAHADFKAAIAGLPISLRGRRPKGASHSPWEILEHMRLAQWDILEFSRHPEHTSPEWPSGYWPRTQAPTTSTAWNQSAKAFHADLKAMSALIQDSSTNLYAKIPWGSGQTILREALLIADHNAYHLGEMVLVRRLLGSWK
jgi:hypothetical protein